MILIFCTKIRCSIYILCLRLVLEYCVSVWVLPYIIININTWFNTGFQFSAGNLTNIIRLIIIRGDILLLCLLIMTDVLYLTVIINKRAIIGALRVRHIFLFLFGCCPPLWPGFASMLEVLSMLRIFPVTISAKLALWPPICPILTITVILIKDWKLNMVIFIKQI